MENIYEKAIFIILGAIVSTIITYLMNIKKFKIEQHNEKCKEMIKSVSISTDIAFEYWSTKHDDDKILIKEAKLFGSQCLVESYYTNLIKSLKKKEQLENVFSEYIRELTGGNFQVKLRDIDPERMNNIAQKSGKLISTIYDCYKRR